jgi:UPF0755 protein
MPDNSSPFDDPLADLYGKLPDPRRDGDGDGALRASEPPTSRRAARAARAETGPTNAQPSAAQQPATQPPAARPPITRPPAEPVAAPRAAQQPPGEQPRATSAQTRTTQTRPAAQHPRTSSRPQSNARAGAPAATGTLDDLFTGRRSIDDVGSVPPPSEKRRRRIGGWIAFAIVVVILGGIVGGGVWAWNSFGAQIQGMFAPDEPVEFEPGIAQGEATITIVSGDAGPQVSQKLFDAGVTKGPGSFYDYLIANSTVVTFQPGVFRFQQQMTSEAALAALRDPANHLTNTAQLPEGLTVEQTITRISEQTEIPLDQLEAAVADPAAYGVNAQSLEGWLFPATYTFDPGTTAADAVTQMVDRTRQSLDAAGVAEADRERILTIASIVQREARFEADFYKVSQVIQNRLDPSNQETFGKLQMDSTAQYGYGELHDGTASSSEEALEDPNPWNTYVNTGLPVGPIANPGDLAIQAALNPEPGPWLYFVTVNLDTGETEFTTTYAEHQEAIGRMNAWCRDHPDSGC